MVINKLVNKKLAKDGLFTILVKKSPFSGRPGLHRRDNYKY